MALVGTNGQGVGTSVFHQWANNCKKHLSPNQMELFEQFLDSTYDAMEQGYFFKSFFALVMWYLLMGLLYFYVTYSIKYI